MKEIWANESLSSWDLFDSATKKPSNIQNIFRHHKLPWGLHFRWLSMNWHGHMFVVICRAGSLFDTFRYPRSISCPHRDAYRRIKSSPRFCKKKFFQIKTSRLWWTRLVGAGRPHLFVNIFSSKILLSLKIKLQHVSESLSLAQIESQSRHLLIDPNATRAFSAFTFGNFRFENFLCVLTRAESCAKVPRSVRLIIVRVTLPV